MDDGVIARVALEARVRAQSTASFDAVARAVRWGLEKCGTVPTSEGARVPLERALEDATIGDVGSAAHGARVLLEDVERVVVRDVVWKSHDGGDASAVEGRPRKVLYWQCDASTCRVYALHDDAPGEEMDGADDIATYREWVLPNSEFEGAWESLVFDEEKEDVKGRLLRYASSALAFSRAEVDARLISWNRVVLLHGPPGTGKTTLCKALAQRLSIRFNDVFKSSVLIEVNAHSLFSRWFSESGKLVSKLFGKIQELLEDESSLVFVLVDEVESLAAARKNAANGSEPSDAIRVVNALLTQIDALKARPNAIVLTTSNITEAIDVAFVDRADIRCYIGPPGVRARYEILHSCVRELSERQLLEHGDHNTLPAEYGGDAAGSDHNYTLLREAAEASEGFSGRALRKLPFLAYSAAAGFDKACKMSDFLNALKEQARKEIADKDRLRSA